MKWKLSMVFFVLGYLSALGQRLEVFEKSARTEEITSSYVEISPRVHVGLDLPDSTIVQGWDHDNNHQVYRYKETYSFNSLLYRSIIKYFWNESASNWDPAKEKHDYVYDSLNNLKLHTHFSWDNVSRQWVPAYRREKTYDKHGRELTDLDFEWDHDLNQWKPDSRLETEYDAKGNTIRIAASKQNDNIDTQVVWSKYEYTFDEQNHLITEVQYGVDEEKAILAEFRKTEHSYNMEGYRVLTLISGRSHGNSSLAPNTQTKYQYDAYGRKIREVTSVWHELVENWQVSFTSDFGYNETGNMSYKQDSWYKDEKLTSQEREEYDFDDMGNQILTTLLHWDKASDQIVNNSMHQRGYNKDGQIMQIKSFLWDDSHSDWYWYFNANYGYDQEGRETSYSTYIWDLESQKWINNELLEDSYDENGNWTKRKIAFWSDTNSDWIVVYQGDCYYSNPGDRLILALNETKTILYPNPTKDYIHVRPKNNDYPLALKLYDSRGTLVIEELVEARDPINISHLEPGIYVFHLLSRMGVEKGKIIKE